MKRVSNENKPVGSVSDASMSPRSSLTTKVLPSRILTCPSLNFMLLASPGPGRIRWNSMRSSASPSHTSSPRSIAAIAFTRPEVTPSNNFFELRTRHVGSIASRDTAIFPWSSASTHVSTWSPSDRSKRSVPVALASSTWWPCASRSPKNLAAVLVIHASSEPDRDHSIPRRSPVSSHEPGDDADGAASRREP